MTEDWQPATLGDAFTLVKAKVSPSDIAQEIPYVGLEHIEPGSPRLGVVGRVSDVSSLVTPFLPGDTLFGRLRPYLRKVALAEIAGVCTPEVLVLRPTVSVLPGFLHLLAAAPSTIEHAVAASAGTRMPRTSPTDLARIEVALPPLEVQRRIVDLIGAIDAHVADLQTQADAAATLMAQMRAQVLVGLDSARRCRLGDVLGIVRGGSPRPIDEFFTDDPDGINWIKIGDVAPGGKYIDRTAQRITPAGVNRSRRVKPGDFLLSNSMSFGRPYIVRIDGCIHDGWLALRDASSAFDQDFLYHLLLGPEVQNQLERLAAGSGVRNLNIGVVQTVEVPVPEMGAQREVAATLDAAFHHVSALRREHSKLVDVRAQALDALLSRDMEVPEAYDRLMSGVA